MTGRRGMLTFDLIAAAGLIVVMVAGFTLAVRQFVHARDYTDAQRLLRLAAEAELNRLRAGLPATTEGAGIRGPGFRENGGPAGEQPGAITLETSKTAGTGAWSEFTRVTVAARKQIRGGRWVRVELSTFLSVQEVQP